jgi:hypothetical protein
MQDVQTLSRFGVLPTMAFTRWMFGFQRREVRRCEWEMLLPKPGPLPQTSQLAATVDLLKSRHVMKDAVQSGGAAGTPRVGRKHSATTTG